MEKQDNTNVALLEKIYIQKYMIFYSYAFAQTQSTKDAEDLVQDTFCTALEKNSCFSNSTNPEGWIMKTLKNKIKNFNRKNANCLTINLDEYWIHQLPNTASFDIDQSIGLLECAHATLSNYEYKILQFILFEGHTFREASQLFQLPIWTCQKKYQRMLKKIRPKAEILIKNI